MRVPLPLTQEDKEQRGHPRPFVFKAFLDLHLFVGLSLR